MKKRVVAPGGILFLCGILFLASCEKNASQPTCALPDPEFKAWCSFQVGSWWIYKKYNSGMRDTVYVRNYTAGQINNSDGLPYSRFEMQVESSSDSIGMHYYTGGTGMSATGQNELIETYNSGSGTITSGRFYTTTDNNLAQDIICTDLDSFTLLNGLTFFDVKKFDRVYSVNGNWIKTEYYVRTMGVVRRELFNGEIWEINAAYLVQ